jgi:hypothetical protein
MTTITQKRKLSKSGWLLIILAFAAVIGVVVCAALGVIDLSWLGTGFLGIYVTASQDLILAILLTVGWIALGILGYYVLIKYFIGNKVTTTMPTYTPQGQTLSNPQQQGQETVIS